MKSASSLLLATAALCAAQASEPIQRLFLDEYVIITVPVATNRVTTISFPGPIAAIDAAGVTTDGKVPGTFQLAHTKGAAFLSVRALARKVATNLNIRWNQRTYVVELIESDAPVLALNLEDRSTPSGPLPAPAFGPTGLLALLDKAKAYPLLKAQHPEVLGEVQARTFRDPVPRTEFAEYEIQIDEVFRFNVEDTLVFHLLLHNKSDQPIRYQPGSFALRVGNRIYPQSISDASGLMPPRSTSTVYFAVTGTPDGARNEISLNNEFSVLLTRFPPLPETSSTSRTAITK